MDQKFVIAVLNAGTQPADNGLTIHALKLAKELRDGGAEVMVVFEGQGVSWIDRFASRDESSDGFVKHYGYAFDAIRDVTHACNMCCKRFEAVDAVTKAGIPIEGAGEDHINLGRLALAGYRIINH